ncbi:MAG: exodeoxyribonuclease V subunit gamma [Clostridia bacterium]|nr:exodeoxyribonuclease V subunit gamma [Clostridia bacterium]
MLRFIIGEKGSGKTAFVHRLLARAVRDEGRQAVLLVPRQFTFESDKGILDAMGPKDACEVEVLSFSRLADVVFKTLGGPARPILGDGANAALMALALSSLQEQLRVFSRQTGSIGFVKKLLRQAEMFKQNMISVEMLRDAAAALPNGYLKQKLEETALILQTHEALVERRFFDGGDVLTAVGKRLQGSDFFREKVVVIDGFSAFTKQELAILEAMLKTAKDVIVTLCSDDVLDRSVLSPFAVPNRTARQLIALARKNDVEVADVRKLTPQTGGTEPHATAALTRLAAGLFDPQAAPYDGDCTALTLQFAPSVREECDAAAQSIRRLLRTGRYRCRDIAVTFRAAQPYARMMRASLKKCGVPIFEDRRASVQNEPLMILVRSLLSVCAEGVSTEQLMRYLKTGLSGMDWGDIAALENYAILWDLTGKQWAEPWTANPAGFGVEFDDALHVQLDALNALRASLMAPLLTFRSAMKDASAKEQMGLVYRFLTENGVDAALKAYALKLESAGEIALALEQEQIWDLLMETLNEIAVALEDAVVSPQLLLSVFDLILANRTLGKLPDGYDEVDVCDAARIGTLSPKVVFVLGMNAGVFPPAPAEDGLFSAMEAEALQAVLEDVREDEQQQAAKERFLVYQALCAARERLVVSWSLTAPSGEKTGPSEVIATLRRLFPGAKPVAAAQADASLLCEGTQNAFEYMARNWHSGDGQVAALKQYFALQPEYRERLAALERAVQKKDFRFADPARAKALFGRRVTLSPTQLETFELCPFRYFCRYGMRAKPRQIARLDPANGGKVVHYVLEQLLKRHSADTFAALPLAQASQEIEDLLRIYMETYMGGTDGKSRRFCYLFDRLKKTLTAIVERLLTEFRGSDFVPWGFEVKIGHGGEIAPYTVPLQDGFVELCGVVDRIDKMDAGDARYLRVVDYKTGPKSFSLSDVLGGLGMQMLLYLVGICRSDNKKYRGAIPAGVLYLPARFEPYDADRADDEETLRQKRLAGGKMDGMLLDDAVALQGMDTRQSGLFLPVKAGNAKGVKGDFITLSQLGKLAKRMDKIMADMGAALHAGAVAARPVVGTGHGDTCDWCDFASVCRHERDGAVRYLEKRSHADCLSILDGGEAQ